MQTNLPLRGKEEGGDPLQLPERYARNHDERCNAKGDKEEVKKLDLQCKGWGFFQVIIFSITISVHQANGRVYA
jgi:hypothetical protein